MSKQSEAKVLYLNPKKILINKYNPRRLFDKSELNELRDSIHYRGILVPLTVYRNTPKGDEFVLLDGDRRLRCAKDLKLKLVPANEIAKPDPVENIVLMFNIHNVRVDWEFVPTALALEKLIPLLEKQTKRKGKKKISNTELAKLTSLKSGRVGEYRRALKYKKYFHLALVDDPKKRLGGDFFSQLDLVMDKLENYPEIIKNIPKAKIVDILIEKKIDGTIINMLKEFRQLKKILDAQKEGVAKKRIVENVTQYLKSEKIVDRSGNVKSKAMKMDVLYEKTAYAVYTEKDIIKTATSLLKLLEKINYSEVEDKREFRKILNDLANQIDEILGN